MKLRKSPGSVVVDPLFNVPPIVCGSSVFALFCYALLCVHSSFSIILKRKRKLVVLLLLSYRCIFTIHVMWLFLTVPWVGLQYVIVVFPDHTHLLLTLIQDLSVIYHANKIFQKCPFQSCSSCL